MNYEDKEIVCKDCGCTFIFTAGEQGFFDEHQFVEPKRCKACRTKKKQDKEARENTENKAT
jgi:hypothetical protein